jgi:hypothetical protein
MKVKIKISYEWEEDLTEAWEEWKADGYSIEEFKEKEICYQDTISRLDTTADNHICYDYKRNLEVKWDE